MRQILSITRKELDSYFSSPMALIFVGVFLSATLFAFFWVDAFWSRNLADVRPLFRGMPLLMIFLVAALTMRQWSEEQQAGTLEILLTMPLRTMQLVLGKFLAVVALVVVALLMTVFLPITISMLGNLDFGPVIGGYIAAILMASAYVAIGLFVSSRTDNQIVALIVTVLTCGALHMVGTSTVTSLFGSSTAELLRDISTSGRFASIERGVIDLRDLLYYVSLTGIFLALNMLSLDAKRWGSGSRMAGYRLNSRLAVALIALNLIVFNVLASDVSAARLDLTADGLYTLSDVTRDTLQDLQEPLLIRGYFSEENHPLLEPLIPVIRDTLEEYRIASNGNLDVEFIDPIDDPELEAEANQTYGIRPTPLQVVDRAGSSLLNIYFDILIRYGDQTEVITFGELIEVDQFGDEIEVRLRNLEYDLTSRIRRVVSGFQSIDAVLAALEEPARLTFYVTPGTLPEDLAEVPATIDSVANEIASISGGNFVFETVDPSDPASGVSPESLFNTYEIRPISAGFFSPDSYYLHMVLQAGGQSQVIYPTGAFSEAEVRTSIESALKRVSTGFLQVVGVWLPPQQPTVDQFGQQIPSLAQYTIIATALNENYEVRPVDLSTGQVPADIDVLFLIAPQNFGVREVFAVDQFVMRGGSLLVAAARYRLTLNSDGSIAVAANEGTLADLLASYGINVEPTLVLDTQNEPFPLPTQRNVGGVTVTEMRALDFPHFVDVRPDGMDRDTPIFSNLPAITMSFVSPVTADPALTDGMDVITLLQSTGDSWTSNSTSIIPNPDIYPETGFQVTTERGPRSLAVAVTGSFTSAFAGQPSPFAPEPTLEPPPPTETPEPDPEATAEATSEATPEVTAEPAPVDPLALVGAIEQSPPNTRIMVIGSVEFLNDNLLQLSTQISGDRYLNNLAFVENAVDWFTEDTALSSIRASGASTRLLDELDESEETQWEVINYALALASVVVLGVIWRVRKGAEQPMELVPRDGAPVVAAAPVVEPEDGPEPDEPDEIEPDDGDAGGADTEADDDDRTGGDA